MSVRVVSMRVKSEGVIQFPTEPIVWTELARMYWRNFDTLPLLQSKVSSMPWHALAIAHRASMQLRVAEDRVSKLEAQMQG